MKKGPEHPEASRKKLVSEYLKNADRFLKSGEYDAALEEVEKSLGLEPGNFYAQAYKERIAVLKEKHAKPGGPAPAPGAPGTGATPHREGRRSEQSSGTPAAAGPADSETGDSPADGLTAEEERTPDSGGTPPQGTSIQDLEEQLTRDRQTHESETQRQAEELARKALEDEIRQGEEAARLKVLEQTETERAIAGAREEAKAGMIEQSLRAAREFIGSGKPDDAFRALSAARILDPSHGDLETVQGQIDELLRAGLAEQFPQHAGVSRETVVALYSRILRIAWTEGVPSRKQQEILTSAKAKLGITPEEGKGLLAGIQKEVFAAALKEIHDAGEPDPEQAEWLKKLAAELAVDDAEIERLKASLTK